MPEQSGMHIQALRKHLLRARLLNSLPLLAEVEEGLQMLAQSGYRCCLLDYERCEAACYVRLLEYRSSRLKAQIEYPIEPRIDPVQWLPLSHLADYGEAESRASIHAIYASVAPFIRTRRIALEKALRVRQNGRAPQNGAGEPMQKARRARGAGLLRGL